MLGLLEEQQRGEGPGGGRAVTRQLVTGPVGHRSGSSVKPVRGEGWGAVRSSNVIGLPLEGLGCGGTRARAGGPGRRLQWESRGAVAAARCLESGYILK